MMIFYQTIINNKIIKMLEHEVKLKFKEEDRLRDVIEKSYFKDGQMGKILDKHSLKIEENDNNYKILKDLHDATIKIENSDVIDGYMRFTVTVNNNSVYLTPASIYSIPDNNNKYIFY